MYIYEMGTAFQFADVNELSHFSRNTIKVCFCHYFFFHKFRIFKLGLELLLSCCQIVSIDLSIIPLCHLHISTKLSSIYIRHFKYFRDQFKISVVETKKKYV